MRAKVPWRQTVGLLGFVGACFALTLFLWTSFGGSVPLGPRGYRMTVSFQDASQLVPQADVRIAGVNVGKVVSRSVDPRTRLTVAELEIAPEYAPRPRDTRAILRQKTLLGEVYLQLSPGSPGTAALPDGGALPAARVAPTVRVDQLLSTFDRSTRTKLATWLTDAGTASEGAAPAVSSFLAGLAPAASSTERVLSVLREDDEALGTLVRDGGSALDALSRRPGELRRLVVAANGTFGATAARDAALAESIRTLPTFLRETRATADAVADFAEGAKPLADQLRPSARELAPTLAQLDAVTPSLETLLRGLGPLERASRVGVPALERQLDVSAPLLARARPFLGGLVPVLDYANAYRRELAGLVSNLAATTQATLPGARAGSGPLHYARGSVPINMQSLSAYPTRSRTVGSNPYPAPGAALELPAGLRQLDAAQCSTRPVPGLSPELDSALRQLVTDAYLSPGDAGPSCRVAAPLGPRVGGGSGTYPALEALP